MGGSAAWLESSLDAPLVPIPITVDVIEMSAQQIEATGFKLK
jgi:hypothetical protein